MILQEHDTQQVCSSINNFEKSFLPSNLSWYSSLNYSSCYWTFSTWLPIDHLIQCKANITLSNFQITLDIFVVYFHINFNQKVEVSYVHSLKSELIYSVLNPCLPAPIHYHPEVHGTFMTHSYVYPISTKNMVYFYMVGYPESYVFKPSEPSKGQLLLLHTTMEKSAWKFWSDQHVSTLDIIFQKYESVNQTISPPSKLMLSFFDSSCIPLLRHDSIIHLKNNASSLNSEFKIGNYFLYSLTLLMFIIIDCRRCIECKFEASTASKASSRI